MARLRLFLHYVILFAAGLPGAMVTVISAVYLVTVLNVDPFIVGCFVNAATVLGVIITFQAGRGGLDRRSPALVAALSLGAVAALVLCLVATRYSVWMLAPATLFRAFGHLLMPAIYVFDERHRPPGEDPETGMYMTRLTSSVVWILGPPAAYYLFWLGSFSAVAVAGIGLAIAAAGSVVGVSLFADRTEAAAPHAGNGPAAPSAAMPVWAVFTVMLMVTGANVLHAITLPLYLLKDLSVPTYWPGWNMTVAAATEVVVIFFIPRLVRRVSEEALLQVGLVLGTVYFALLFLVTAPELILVLQVIYGAHFALSTVVCLGILKNASQRRMGSVAAQFVNASRIGGLLGTTLFALLAVHLGYGNLVRGFGLGLVGVGLVVSAIRWLREPAPVAFDRQAGPE